jgi:hypothetical protein
MGLLTIGKRSGAMGVNIEVDAGEDFTRARVIASGKVVDINFEW